MVQSLHDLPDGLGALVLWPPVAHRVLTADRTATIPAGTYHGGVLRTGSGGASTVDIYDGPDASSGDPVDAFATVASGHEVRFLERGIIIRRGLFIDIGSNVTSFTLYYRPPPRELA